MSINSNHIRFNMYTSSCYRILIPDNVHVNNTNWYKKFMSMNKIQNITIGGGY